MCICVVYRFLNKGPIKTHQLKNYNTRQHVAEPLAWKSDLLVQHLETDRTPAPQFFILVLLAYRD